MAMGLRNSSFSFHRLMNSVLSGLLGNSVFCYLDDIIVASANISDKFATLTNVFAKLSETGLKLKLLKCSFLKSQIKFVSQPVNKDGIHASDDKIHAINRFPTLENIDQVRYFLGFAGCYRQFIHDYSKIASPLTKLLKTNATFT